MTPEPKPMTDMQRAFSNVFTKHFSAASVHRAACQDIFNKGAASATAHILALLDRPEVAEKVAVAMLNSRRKALELPGVASLGEIEMAFNRETWSGLGQSAIAALKEEISK